MTRYLGLFDDRGRVPDEVSTFTGVERYGDLLHRKRPLRAASCEALAQAGADPVEALVSEADLDRLSRSLDDGQASARALLLPATVVVPAGDGAAVLLTKLRFGNDALAIRAEGASPESAPVLAGPLPLVVSTLAQARHRSWPEILADPQLAWRQVPNLGGLRDLGNREVLVDFLSNTFDVRHFNSIQHDRLTVTKRSRDAAKMRREFAHYHQLQGQMRLFFLEPLEFLEDDGSGTGYRTERMSVPDMAVQWIHRSLDADAFAVFLDKLGAFLALRPTRPCTNPAAIESLYPGKVRERLAALHADSRAAGAIATLDRSGPPGGLAGLADRFETLWRAATRRQPREAVSHGDLCFSNILYSRHSRQMKFIDPRGAESPEELYLDEYYDLAKLCHSVLGAYDFVNHDLIDLRLDRELRLSVHPRFEAPMALQEQFRSWLTDAGFDLGFARLAEASLFLSMLPLHVDVPKKVVAFAMIAAEIIERLEQGRP